MKICPYCGKEIPDRAVKCKYCYMFIDEKTENINNKSEATKKIVKHLSTEEAAELEQLVDFYNKGNSTSSIIRYFLYCTLVILGVNILIRIFKREFHLGELIYNISRGICLIRILRYLIGVHIRLYKTTKKYMKYTGVNARGGPATYRIPIIHINSSPKLIEQIREKFSSNEKLSKYLKITKIRKSINVCYVLGVLSLLFAILTPILYLLKCFSDEETLVALFIIGLFVAVLMFAAYSEYYLNKLKQIDNCILGRINGLQGANVE